MSVETHSFQAEVEQLLADPSRVKNELGWDPKVSFRELVAMIPEIHTSCCAVAP